MSRDKNFSISKQHRIERFLSLICFKRRIWCVFRENHYVRILHAQVSLSRRNVVVASRTFLHIYCQNCAKKNPLRTQFSFPSCTLFAIDSLNFAEHRAHCHSRTARRADPSCFLPPSPRRATSIYPVRPYPSFPAEGGFKAKALSPLLHGVTTILLLPLLSLSLSRHRARARTNTHTYTHTDEACTRSSPRSFLLTLAFFYRPSFVLFSVWRSARVPRRFACSGNYSS